MVPVATMVMVYKNEVQSEVGLFGGKYFNGFYIEVTLYFRCSNIGETKSLNVMEDLRDSIYVLKLSRCDECRK